MVGTLKYGADSTVQLPLPPESLVVDCAAPRGAPLASPADAVRQALAAPLAFPPLSRAMAPGDRVALALDRGTPQLPAIVAAVVETLLAAGAEPQDVSILLAAGAESDLTADLVSHLPEEARGQIRIEIHDPADRGQLSYLAANSHGQPIYLNRHLGDADLVLPIGCLRPEPALAYHGVHDALFPAFSDQATIQRFSAGDVEGGEKKELQREETDEVAWLLGVLFTIQVVPGAGDTLLHVLAGEPAAVFRQGSQLCQEAWRYSAPRRATLVVAAIEGAPPQQTWENVGRALAAASRVVADDGAIALCTDLEAPPGPALQRLAGAEDLRSAVRQMRKDRSRDLVPATQLVSALQRVKVYLLSRLQEDVVEGLGVAHVHSGAELARLAGRHKSCILLANAQLAVATVEGEGE